MSGPTEFPHCRMQPRSFNLLQKNASQLVKHGAFRKCKIIKKAKKALTVSFSLCLEVAGSLLVLKLLDVPLDVVHRQCPFDLAFICIGNTWEMCTRSTLYIPHHLTMIVYIEWANAQVPPTHLLVGRGGLSTANEGSR